MDVNYIPLRVHSHYSFLTGVGSPGEYLARAAELGIEALAVTELGGLYGALRWHAAARESTVRVILGVELEAGSLPRTAPVPGRILCLAQDLAGYRALCRIVTAEQIFHDPRGPGAEGICPPHHDRERGELPREELEHLFVLADHPRLLARLATLVPPGHLYAALDRRRHGGAAPAESGCAAPRKALDPCAPQDCGELVRAAAELGIPLVVAEEVFYPHERDLALHRRVLAIKHNCLEQQVTGAAADAWLRAPGEMARRYADQPAALAATREIAAACHFEPELDRVHFPHCPLPAGETPFSHLWALTMRGIRRRYRPLRPAVTQRLEYELKVIHELGFAEYFLLVKRIHDFAREQRIPTIGRGSAAASMVAYALGFTAADPLRYKLPFERFLNPSRSDLPDIDLDFCWRRRDEVIEYVYRAFGRDRTAMICTLNTFGLRAAFRESAKAAGLPPHEVNRWSRALPHGFAAGVRAAAEAFPECRAMPRDREPLRGVLASADRLLGAPRHLGLHPGGVIVAPHPLTDFLPLERAAKGVVVSQYDKDDVARLGLVKMDLLGNRGLTTLADALELVRAHPDSPPPPRLEDIPEDDPSTAALLAAGDTIGCFQIESPGMRTLLKDLGAVDMERTIQAIALIRPGPASSGMKDRFVRRLRGIEETVHLHPDLSELLAGTFGIMLYQEDVLFVGQIIAGMELAEADALRRAMKKWREPQVMAELEKRFVGGALGRGVEEAAARRIWRLVRNFAAFSFCKAHAVTYGRMAYQAAYLKAHHPLEFMTAFLNSETGYYETRVYIEDLRRRGFAIRPPDLNRSRSRFRVEYPPGAEPGALRAGLGHVRGIRAEAVEQLLDSRHRHGPFLALRDLLERSALEPGEIENLILCGALDAFDRTRPELLWRLQLLTGRRGNVWRPPTGTPEQHTRPRARVATQPRSGPALFSAPELLETPLPALPEYSTRARYRLEMELLGFSASHHPLDFFTDRIASQQPIECSRLDAHIGRHVAVVGWLVTTRRTHTSRGEPMRFLSLEDRSGVVEGVLFPDTYRRFGHRLRGAGPYLARGKVTASAGSLTLEIAYLELWEEEGTGAELPPG